MLKSLHIHNFAIIRDLELDFHAGMSVLTGETGAGKSIIIDAMGLVLGDRAELTAIRTGEERAEISLLVDLTQLENSRRWLAEHDFDVGEDCILRRVLKRSGTSKAYINNVLVPLKTLKEFGELIINIYGQHAHQGLMQKSHQRQLLDQFAENEKLCESVAKQYQVWSERQRHYQSLSQNSEDINAKLELLSYQLKELESLDLQPNESEELTQRHLILANAEQLKQGSNQISHQLKNEEGDDLSTTLGHINNELDALATHDPSLNTIASALNEALILIEDNATSLRHYADRVEVDEQELLMVEERLTNIEQISRKHHISSEEIPVLHAQLQAEYEQLNLPENDIETLAAMLQESEQKYRDLAKKLSQKRVKVAAKLSKSITQALTKLGMSKAKLEISVSGLDSNKPSQFGLDNIVFNVQTNPGQAMAGLAQVASGGELSRISLAIQMIAADKLDLPVLIFDEVDSGVGGAVAEIVGQEMHNISSGRQVFSVTHLAQVAAKADHHYRVNKLADDKDTASAIDYLERQDRVTELARMLGGLNLTEKTLSHAEEMLDS
jgi:DNA repair protein RecN (Recombination protein N)